MSMDTPVFRKQAGLFIGLALLAFVFPSVGEPQDTIHRSGQDMLVMSFNVRWDGFDDDPNGWSKRRDSVVALIKQHQPDIIGFQEPSKQQTRDLADALPGYRIVQEAHERALHIPIAVKIDRFIVTASGSFWLVDRSPLQGGTRRCAWLRLLDNKTTKELYVYNVHLDGRDPIAHLNSVAKLIANIIERKPKAPFVVTGDFNQVETGSSIRYLTDSRPVVARDGRQWRNPLPLSDTFRRIHGAKTGVGTGHGFTGRTDGGRIDYIFVELTSDVLDASILRSKPYGIFPSDHYPVTARVRLN